ncbi:CocE/NonD family hydrolase [Streptomyces sp. HNM0663]|uniref:CocE/NonD family hydrolase n=1 Tax=Streptomyces chengmaiensis TaxID=3040919 RepID=A0ABT6HV41_9ACTN|nr:CocE/NonD family hydrolase [Streptomyces chengmaiensis]MDH2391714.1 CocE/NonD family hydrolase [Streptomyces chengmaiensis]
MRRIRTDFPYETLHEDVRIPLRDGVRLYARVWRPLTDEPVPALLEYVPYRLTDWTAPRDWQRHPWYAGHGYASVRVDVRGHGNSEGTPGDEYTPAETSDGIEVIDWLAGQPWCSGRVGMFGISWGGYTALRIAALTPEPLAAVVAVCTGDDRYDNDVHYLGGSLLAEGMHARSAALLALAARPPDPVYAGDGWRELWLRRLDTLEPLIHTWLAHQTRDAYWTESSVREDCAKIEAAVLAVGGWHDPCRDAVLRLAELLPPDRVRGIIGPWCHQYPDRGRPPGPSIGFLQETLRWWDRHLKGADNDVLSEPLLRCWISRSHPPATVYPELPGRWVGEPSWPSPHLAPVTYGLTGAPVPVRSPEHTGLDAGRHLPLGNDADLPPDQRAEDARCACFEFPVAEADGPVEILGCPRVTLRLRLDVPYGQVAARLCDVAPDGASTLVTRGVLNLAARHGHDRADAWPPGASESVTFELSAIGHTFPPGHRIRLAVSSAYWPWIWPQSPGAHEDPGFTLEPSGSHLELPVRTPTEDAIAFEEPEQSEPLGVSSPATLDEQRPERLVIRDVAKGEWRLELVPRYGGTRIHPDGLEYTEDTLDAYTIQEDDPLSAHARSDWTIRLHRPDLPWDVRLESRSELGCDEADFLLSNELVCRDGKEIVFHRTWEKHIPRREN